MTVRGAETCGEVLVEYECGEICSGGVVLVKAMCLFAASSVL